MQHIDLRGFAPTLADILLVTCQAVIDSASTTFARLRSALYYPHFMKIVKLKHHLKAACAAVNNKPEGAVLGSLIPDIIGGMNKNNAQAVQDQLASRWIATVIEPLYKMRHEFMRIGIIPDFVIKNKDVNSLIFNSNEIFISDHQARHAVRDSKKNRGASIPIEKMIDLPNLLKSAKWYVDSRHNGLIATIDVGLSVGKFVIALNYKKDKELHRNVVITAGIVQEHNLKERWYIEIL